MPFSSRGAKYYGNIHDLLNCGGNHDKIADALYNQLQSQGEVYGTTECGKCGAFITVSVRGNGEWEHREFAKKGGQER